MSGDAQVFELLEQILDSGKSPEEVCVDFPELLSDVRQRWRDFQIIDQQLRTLLPTLEASEDVVRLAPPENMPEPPAAFGRYEVRGRLGAGGFGAVYLGQDPQLERPVAIKVLNARVMPGQSEQHALQEARRVAQLRHSGIVAVHDAGVHDGQVFIVSDFIEGPDLSRRLQDQQLGWAEAALLAATVAEALAYAHSKLIIHRDVKPANILLTSDGAPVLVDFGLALDENQVGGEAIGIVAGTPWYMSPEQAAGTAHRIDGRTDIYSMGVVLYEMLTGRVPFRATKNRELLRQVRDDEPQPPRQLVGDIPPELERICLKALAKRQQDRYTTAADFAADLSRIVATTVRDEWSGSQPSWSLNLRRSPIERHTVGRQKEIGELVSAFDSAAAGQGQILCVTGEPGSGKTTVVEGFLNELAFTGRIGAIARGRCSERLAGTEAYLPFLDALESLLHADGGEAAAQLMKSSAPNWYEQVAPLAAKDSSLLRALAESKAASQERLKRELAAFLRELSQRAPLLLFIDDLHWADASTVDFLAYLGAKCTEFRVLIVLTYRPSDLALAKHPWGPTKLDLQARGVCRELALEFLTLSDLDRYLVLEFPDHQFPEEFAALIHHRTEGSPLFMADLLRYLRDRNVLMKKDGCWRLCQSLPDLGRDLPESVRGMIQRKIDQLREDDHRLLVAASVQGYEFDSAVVARVLEMDAEEVEDRLDQLDRVHAFVRLLQEQEYPDHTLTLKYRFVHVLYQNALDASLRPTRRAAFSAAVARALQEYYTETIEEVAAELALLFERARDFAHAADYFLMAAQKASRIFANQEAVVLARRGLEVLALLPNTPERARTELALQVTLGPALFATKDWTASDVETAYTRAQVLCREVNDSPDLFAALWGLFLFHIARGKIQNGLSEGEHLLSLAQRANDPALLLQAHHALGPTCCLSGDWASAQAHLDQAIGHYDFKEHRTHAFLYGGHDPYACCQGFAAKTLWMLGYPEQALQRGEDALLLARKLGHPTSLAHTQFSVAMLYQFHRLAPEVLELTEQLQSLAADQGLQFYLSGGIVLHGWALVEQGDFPDGIRQIQQGFDLGGATRAHWRSYLLALYAEACGKAGNSTQGLAILSEALTIAETTEIQMYEPEMHRLKGELLRTIDPGDVAAAEACFHRAVALARVQQAKSLELRATMSLARLWQVQGRSAEAHSSLSAIYGAYTEGFTTSELVEAAAQLKSLA